MVIVAPSIHLLIMFQHKPKTMAKRYFLNCAIHLYFVGLFLPRVKSIHLVFVRNHCGKLVIEVDTYRVLILSLHFLFDSCELLQPLTLIILRADNVVISNIHLEGILVIELNRLINLPILACFLTFAVLTDHLLREKLDPNAYGFWIIFDSSHFDRKCV